MSDLVGNPEDSFPRDADQMLYQGHTCMVNNTAVVLKVQRHKGKKTFRYFPSFSVKQKRETLLSLTTSLRKIGIFSQRLVGIFILGMGIIL